MYFDLNNLILLLTAIVVALIAGLFYTWSSSIIPGLSKLEDREYIAAMQSINRKIQNPVFFSSFFGAMALLPLCCYMQYIYTSQTKFLLILGAILLYLFGVVVITIFGNIPLNEALDKFDLQDSIPTEVSKQRLAFERMWNRLNIIRAISSILSLVLVLIVCIHNEGE